MADRLVVCGGCSRHAKAFEVRCPFCGHGLSAARPSTGDPYRRMVAAAAVAAAVSTLPACSSESGTVFYGAPGSIEPATDAGEGGAGGGGKTDGPPSVGTYYGIANPIPVDDASAPGDGAAEPTDATATG
jgi:hypothetical protein